MPTLQEVMWTFSCLSMTAIVPFHVGYWALPALIDRVRTALPFRVTFMVWPVTETSARTSSPILKVCV